VKAKTVKPTARVLKSFTNSSPGKLLFTNSIAVGMQTLMNKRALRLGEKLGRIWIILDEPVCRNGYQHGRNTLLLGISCIFNNPVESIAYQDKDPSPSIVPDYTCHFTDALLLFSYETSESA
jgi:hypothetical protein